VQDRERLLHGDDDQIVPIADSALLSAKIVNGAVLKVYKGAPHGDACTMASLLIPMRFKLNAFNNLLIQKSRTRLGHSCLTINEPKMNRQVHLSRARKF
jgi:fermentation-respiration switch protein FrsA (DUF1100 family)